MYILVIAIRTCSSFKAKCRQPQRLTEFMTPLPANPENQLKLFQVETSEAGKTITLRKTERDNAKKKHHS